MSTVEEDITAVRADVAQVKADLVLALDRLKQAEEVIVAFANDVTAVNNRLSALTVEVTRLYSLSGGTCGGGLAVTGLSRFANVPRNPVHHISFQFCNNWNDARKSVARGIRQLFVGSMRKQFGGFIDRLATDIDDDAMSGLYEVHIWTRAVHRDDPKLDPLWEFVTDLLDVAATTILIEQGVPEKDCFLDSFFLSRHPDDSADWNTDFVDDDSSASSFSVASIHYHGG